MPANDPNNIPVLNLQAAQRLRDDPGYKQNLARDERPRSQGRVGKTG